MSDKIRGVIYTHPLLNSPGFVTDRYECLFDKMAEQFGFTINYSDGIFVFDPRSQTYLSLAQYRLRSLNRVFGKEINSPVATPMETLDVDIVFACKPPRSPLRLVDFPPKIKLISYVIDLHTYGKEENREYTRSLFDRSDLIISPYCSAFTRRWPEYVHKHECFPHFFAPHDRSVNLSFNEDPILKIVLSGCIGRGGAGVEIYPIRKHVRDNLSSQIYYLQHPGYYSGGGITKDDYTALIGGHLGAIATASTFGYVVAKYFEIPSTGSLLLGERIPDLDDLGFVPNEHYVPITIDDFSEVTAHCCKNPKLYEDIRRNGMEFVRENHSINNRIIRLEEMIKEVLE